MRKFFGLSVLFVAVAVGAPSAFAQQARHQTQVSIPTVLKLKLDNAALRDSADVDVDITVENGRVDIAPGGTTLEIFANSDWQLSASYRPASERDADARLAWNDGRGAQPFTPYPSVLASGGNTGGWTSLPLGYELAGSVPADGTYQGTITYTLARP